MAKRKEEVKGSGVVCTPEDVRHHTQQTPHGVPGVKHRDDLGGTASALSPPEPGKVTDRVDAVPPAAFLPERRSADAPPDNARSVVLAFEDEATGHVLTSVGYYQHFHWYRRMTNLFIRLRPHERALVWCELPSLGV